MHLDEYRDDDLTGLAGLLADGEVAAAEVHEAAQAAIEQVDADLNAVADGPWPTPLSYDPFTGYDVLVTPTPTTPAWPLGRFDQDEPGVDPETWLRRVFDVCAFIPLGNVTGTPAGRQPAAGYEQPGTSHRGEGRACRGEGAVRSRKLQSPW